MTLSIRFATLTRPPLKRPFVTVMLGLLLMFAGICGTIWTLAIPHRNAQEFRVPGEVTLDVTGPARMTLWNQNAPQPDIRAGELTVLIEDTATGRDIKWQARTNFSIGGGGGRSGSQFQTNDSAINARQTLADFHLPAAGTYRIVVGGTISPRMFAVTHDRGPWYVGPCILFPGALLVFVGIAWTIIVVKSNRQG